MCRHSGSKKCTSVWTTSDCCPTTSRECCKAQSIQASHSRAYARIWSFCVCVRLDFFCAIKDRIMLLRAAFICSSRGAPKAFREFLITLIVCLRPFVAPPGCCRHPISCTVFACEQLRTQPLGKALWAIIKRLASCHPFARQ